MLKGLMTNRHDLACSLVCCAAVCLVRVAWNRRFMPHLRSLRSIGARYYKYGAPLELGSVWSVCSGSAEWRKRAGDFLRRFAPFCGIARLFPHYLEKNILGRSAVACATAQA